MRLLISVYALFALSTLNLGAQDFALLSGTWVSAQFMDAIKRTHDVAWAMKAMGQGQPLWVSIDTSNNKPVVKLAPDFSNEQQLRLFKVKLDDLGERWAIGQTDKPIWMIVPDTQGGQFVSLHWLDSLESNPIVLGKLPTRRTEPDFLLDRIIISSVLKGTWVDSTGAEYTFNSDATARWKGAKRDVNIDVQPGTYAVLVTLADARNRTERFVVARKDSALVVTNEQGKTLTLNPVN